VKKLNQTVTTAFSTVPSSPRRLIIKRKLEFTIDGLLGRETPTIVLQEGFE